MFNQWQSHGKSMHQTPHRTSSAPATIWSSNWWTFSDYMLSGPIWVSWKIPWKYQQNTFRWFGIIVQQLEMLRTIGLKKAMNMIQAAEIASPLKIRVLQSVGKWRTTTTNPTNVRRTIVNPPQIYQKLVLCQPKIWLTISGFQRWNEPFHQEANDEDQNTDHDG